MKYSVLVYGDQEFFCTLLSSYLREHGFQVIKESTSIWDAISEIRNSKPDVLLLDARRSKSNGLEDASIIKGEFPEQKIVILSASKEIEDVKAAINLGVSGYILKSSLSNEVIADLNAICADQVRIPHELAGQVIKDLFIRGGTQNYSISLTPREREILVLISQGKTNKNIAELLLLSPNTIKNHIMSIFSKLDVHSRVGAISKWEEIIAKEKRTYSPEKISTNSGNRSGTEVIHLPEHEA